MSEITECSLSCRGRCRQSRRFDPACPTRYEYDGSRRVRECGL